MARFGSYGSGGMASANSWWRGTTPARGRREAEGLGVADRLAVDGEARRQPDAPVRPQRARRPLVGEHQEEQAVRAHGGQRQARRAPDVVGDGPVEVVGDVDLAALERGRARRLVGDAAQDQALHGGRLAPVAVERLQDQLDARAGGSRTCRGRRRRAPAGSRPRPPSRRTSSGLSRPRRRRWCRRRS